MKFLDRFNLMLDADNTINNLPTKKVIVFGVGGVGGHVAEMLVRSGIHDITVVDFDTIDITNINRQIVALSDNVGRVKVEEMKIRLLSINPNCKVNAINEKLDENNIESFALCSYDFVIDCIDDVKAKKYLIKYCDDNKIKIVVSCGAGNRYKEIPNFQLADIHKTEYDPLAKILRKFCVEERIKKLNVVYTKQKPIKNNCKKVGSVVYFPMSMACAIVAHVINELLLH